MSLNHKGLEVWVMKLFRTEEFIRIKNPNPGKPFKQDIVTRDREPASLGGIFGILEPGTQVPYHVHNKRHTVIIAISGEATAIIEGKEILSKLMMSFTSRPEKDI